MVSQELIDRIQHSLLGELPGLEAQFRMAPPGRGKHPSPDHSTRDAAVMITLYPKNAEWHIVFIERARANKKDRHRGQIGLPGGKKEQDDDSYAATALRETQEEVGIPADQVNLIGQLSELYIPVSNFYVYPFVGYIEKTPELVPQEDEVDRILEIPLNTFLDQQVRKKTKMKLDNGALLPDVPYFDLNGRILWGATAMIMNEFIELLPSNLKLV